MFLITNFNYNFILFNANAVYEKYIIKIYLHKCKFKINTLSYKN